MVRSPPPPSIHPPLASATEIEDGTPKQSDLPLRNYTCPARTSTTTTTPQTASPNHAKLPPTPPHDPSDIMSDTSHTICHTPTPSSTVAEFGDGIFFANKSAVSLVDNAVRSYNRSRSQSETNAVYGSSQGRSRSRSNASTPRDRAGNYTPRSTTSRSQSSSNHRQTSSRERGITTSEKVNRFLHSMTHTPPPQDSQAELLSENRSLHQRISALQRTETELLEQNQQLSRQLEGLKKQYDVRIRQWKDEVREGKKKLLDRIKELESQVAEKDERLQSVVLDEESVLSDEDIVGWFAERTAAWRVWTEEFGHRDPKRVQTGLHPLQMGELCEGVKGFVRLTDRVKLPDELLNGMDDGKVKAAHVLLYGMLSHFIIYEVLQSPFWVFEALSGSVLELESPIVPRNNSMSPVGFRMDLAMWNNIATLGNDRHPQPHRGPAAQPVGRIHNRMSVATSKRSLSLDTANLASLPKPTLPRKQDMENLYNVLSKVQNQDEDAHNWRRQLMRTLSQGGLILDVDKAKSPDSRLLVEARENYAKKLKERFLGGPARYLLEDQDAVGIEKLERRLLHELDLALRFSCQVWSRLDELKFSSLEDFAATEFHAASPIMELCEIQAPGNSHDQGVGVDELGPDAPHAYYDGNAVIMVVQPAVESIKTNNDKGNSSKTVTNIRAKAQVLVRTPVIPSRVTGPTSTPLPPSCEVKINARTPGLVEAAQTVPVPASARLASMVPTGPLWNTSVPASAPLTLQMATFVSSPPPPPPRYSSKRDSPPERLFKVALLEVKSP